MLMLLHHGYSISIYKKIQKKIEKPLKKKVENKISCYRIAVFIFVFDNLFLCIYSEVNKTLTLFCSIYRSG